MPISFKPYKNSFSTRLLILILIFIHKYCSLSIEDTHISTTRNQYRNTICGYYSGVYTSSEISSSKKYINQYNYLSTSEIQDILFHKNFGKINTQTIIIAAPHIISFTIALIIWIPLCCCCVWPQRHPTCKKCRKPQKENYQRCQLKWTAYFTVIFYLVVLIGGALAMTQGQKIVLSFNDIGCKMTAVADDTVYGKISQKVDGRFFSGLNPFAIDLNSFKGSFNTIWTQSSSSLGTAGQVKAKQTTYQQGINNTYTSYTNPVYTQAFSTDGTTYQDVSSAFKTLYYGPPTNSQTILGSMYSTSSVIFNQINAVLDPMIAAWANLSPVTQAGVVTQMTNAINSDNRLQTNLIDFMNSNGKLFQNSSLYKNLVLVLKAFYGCFFALALLGFISAILLGFFSVVRIRLLMYFTCGIMYALSIFSFALLITLSLLGPNLSQICSYMDTKFVSGAGTADFFTKMGSSQLGRILTNCMSDGTGWMINDIQPTFNTSFASLLTIMNNAQLFNTLIPHYSTSNLITPITVSNVTVNSVLNAELMEITDVVATNFISAVRLISYPPTSCNSVNVNADSWMPSYTLYTCPSGKSQNSPCGNLALTSVCPNGCYEIMKQLQSAAGDTSYSGTLATRYGASCNYYTYIKNLQLNWNVRRKNDMSGVQTSLTSLLTKVTDYDNTFKSVQAKISTFSTILQTNYNDKTSLTIGTFNGMDCRVIGQSVIDFRNSICVGFLNAVYYNFIVLILLSYGSLMVACCGTCAGVRHFKHLQRMSINIGYKGVPVSISQKRLFDTDK